MTRDGHNVYDDPINGVYMADWCGGIASTTRMQVKIDGGTIFSNYRRDDDMASGGIMNSISVNIAITRQLTKGDRVRIKEGYSRAGVVGYYVGKSVTSPDDVHIEWDKPRGGTRTAIIAAAVEPYPYTREERIARAIEDFYDAALFNAAYVDTDDGRNLLYAILDAGV